MKKSVMFVALEAVDPVEARRLLPGVKLQVSRRTFAQVAAEKFRGLGGSQFMETASTAQNIGVDDARALRGAVLNRVIP